MIHFKTIIKKIHSGIDIHVYYLYNPINDSYYYNYDVDTNKYFIFEKISGRYYCTGDEDIKLETVFSSSIIPVYHDNIIPLDIFIEHNRIYKRMQKITSIL